MKHSFFCLLPAFCLSLAACGQGGLKGEYLPDGEHPANPIAKIEFKSDGTVYVTSGMGITNQGTYTLDGEKVIVKVGSDSNVLTKSGDDCLDLGGVIGKFCKK